MSDPCPCGSGRAYPACCGPYLDQSLPAPTAEALMRARYTAYTLKREDYLLATWDPAHRPAQLDLASDTATRWLGLQVKRHETTGSGQAIVEFVARYKVAGRAYRLHETSRFHVLGGAWVYVDGDVH
ncbi:MAG TPA: YchJ family metal-binding protein [Zoogloea sp.]|uniref:YchJ family protein n=1 Tax=Zoogloea sp. TaxID=49181 RepID=UPI002B704040|nr:YchJ family metal-binding protein [Zoogloea sp.]HMV16377.1 YchJ family metal-binding protein [Rhodocyclaceae bacterium]HMV61741.1 YchJ family metal-binding protein [Rhodocyclaceae bacterium]HMW51167.1 YchJ family metal-binding protein [Rhodocyclaceae bacterium]HMY48364.1 YchJ family metal-binding protein [Rhodocyclaceae bacterium]HMZ76301.1 YchJ family metal-binding protein [Rhodocyclaceae bacterium]